MRPIISRPRRALDPGGVTSKCSVVRATRYSSSGARPRAVTRAEATPTAAGGVPSGGGGGAGGATSSPEPTGFPKGSCSATDVPPAAVAVVPSPEVAGSGSATCWSFAAMSTTIVFSAAAALPGLLAALCGSVPAAISSRSEKPSPSLSAPPAGSSPRAISTKSGTPSPSASWSAGVLLNS